MEKPEYTKDSFWELRESPRPRKTWRSPYGKRSVFKAAGHSNKLYEKNLKERRDK